MAVSVMERSTADSEASSKKDQNEGGPRSSGLLTICFFVSIAAVSGGVFYLFSKDSVLTVETPEPAQPAESTAVPVANGGGGDGPKPPPLAAKVPDSSDVSDVLPDSVMDTMPPTAVPTTKAATTTRTPKPVQPGESTAVPGAPSGGGDGAEPSPPLTAKIPDPSDVSDVLPDRTMDTMSSTVVPTTKVSTITKRSDVHTPFLCTVTDVVDNTYSFPPDGLCEVIYFQSAYYYFLNAFSEDPTDSFKFFMSYAQLYSNKTRYGVGISQMNNSELLREFTGDSTVWKRLNKFYQYKISNYAVLDVEAMGILTLKDSFQRATAVIGELARHHKRQKHKPGINLIAAMLPRELLADPIPFQNLRKLHHMFNESYKTGRELADDVTYIVFLTHLPYSDKEVATDCQIQTPQVLYRAPSKYPYHRQSTSLLDAYHFNKVLTQFRNMNRYKRAITVTLRTVFKEPVDVDKSNPSIGNFGWNKECRGYGSEQDPNNNPPDVYYWKPWSSYSEICKDSVYSKNIDCAPKGIDEGCLTYDKQRARTIVWDDAISLRRKICISRRNLTFMYGLMVYAINYDDPTYSCPQLSPYGPYSRLRMLYELRNFLRRDYHSEADEAECLKVEPQVMSLEDLKELKGKGGWPEDSV